ncbi:hypothetical protein Ppha_2113 [Pelodictyon phaeoclathratiforme BU-1]|jgi:hypothetical protein|uniref:Uncharacterized protein n=1 Tax=Pelodictyon phaeoclathratiforme (strain DSM 5477 / BU-1) TaxID=324925 RepID=B4SCG4_PELPB|nr:hypothetical protein Ppha_0417 [Pelodictyon phaeoclathratiforme BU-1]ACF44319.1 hypothetical protein Ppha_2113 [Pelodictyon phaeoclathratiforme BU-1]
MSGVSQGRRVQTNCRERVEKIKMTSKLKGVVNSGKVWRKPVYWPSGVRHKGSVILVRALVLNYRNLRWRCKGKGASVKSEADNTNAPSRDGATRTSNESLVMRLEQRGRVIWSYSHVNCANRRSFSV